MAKIIILVHGLGGTADGTWGQFPEFLEKDTELDFSVSSYGYQSPNIVKQFYQRAPSILNIANGLLTELKAHFDLDNDEIILAGHSLGGLVVKKLLLLMKGKKISHKIKKVCFFDVPHDGSGFANVAKYISFRNRHLKSLCRDSSELDDLNDQWIDSQLDNALDILSIIAANDDIVSSSSSKSIFRHHKVETINNVGHKTIVKPESMASSSYVVFKKFILKNNTVNKYKNSASRDLMDWKSIERKHSYHFATDEKRSNNLDALIAALALDRAVIRLTGASGLGKSRLLLEAIDVSDAIDDSCVLVFNAPEYEKIISESIREIVKDHVYGLVIVENCSIELHNQLAKEVTKTDCLLKLVTVGYSDGQVDDSIHIQLSPLSDEAIKQVLLPILIGLDANNVERVARFAEGYPLMATLIAEQYQKEGRLLGSIESHSVVRKLIDGDGDGGITDDEKGVLSVCSLFDVFGTAEGIAGEEARYISENVAGSTLKIFDRVMRIFTGRQIINRAGRYARVVPKPLALTLASEWWEESSYERQKQLIDTLPESLLHSFCVQAAYLDSLPSVQRFSDKLFGGQSPFVQAEALLTERGSKLFRAFVEVNPESTSNALFRILSELRQDKLQAIGGDTRRNLVWGLEKLCFHAEVFEKAAWCMLLLASAENESWGNNATGMFAQLFRVHLSGTQAKPNIRFDVLKRAIECNQPNIDMVVLAALSQAIRTHGGTRSIGAEYQGTKAPLEEWKPVLWQEIFDFWQEAFDLMLVLFERGEAQKEKVLTDIGHSIRSFVAQSRIEMLDVAIRRIVSLNGRNWPTALDSINNVFKYESSKEMRAEAIEALNSWLELLSPINAELPEKLKILVVNPPWEHREGEDGHYVDVASERAKSLAIELSQNIDELLPHMSLLLQGQQQQSDSFGYQLALELADVKPLIDSAFECLEAIEQSNPSLILGIYRGVFEKSPKLWQENIDRLLADEKLIYLYPNFIRTGDIQKSHLDILLDLICRGVISPNSANALSYGSVTNGIASEVIAKFCLQLAELGGQASWTALDVIYMYCFGNKGSIEKLREPLKQLVTAVPLSKGQASTPTDMHHWHDLAEKLLKVPDPELAIALANQLISACKEDLNHGDIWHYTKPLLLNLMKDYGEVIWPMFGDAAVRAEGSERYWLQQLLDREIGLTGNIPSVLSVVPLVSVIEWCSGLTDLGPIFVANCINIFDTVEDQHRPSALFVALLEHFGDDQRVTNALHANIGSFGWRGSVVPHLKSDKEALKTLLDHHNSNVRRWVKDQIAGIDRQIESESMRDEERGIGVY